VLRKLPTANGNMQIHNLLVTDVVLVKLKFPKAETSWNFI